MKAVRFYGKEDVRVEDIEEPQVRPGTVKIRPAFNGICGSDLHLYHEILAEPRLQFSHGLDHDADLFGPADADEWVALVRDSEGNSLGLMSHEARHEP